MLTIALYLSLFLRQPGRVLSRAQVIDDRRANACAAKLAADLEAVLARQHHVEQDEIPPGLACPPRALVAVASDFDVVILVAQVQLEAERDVRFVFDDENAGHMCNWFGKGPAKAGPHVLTAGPTI